MALTIVYFIVSALVIGVILIQDRSSGVSGLFGGEDGGFYKQRRGLERMIFVATIVLVVGFAGISLAAFFTQI